MTTKVVAGFLARIRTSTSVMARMSSAFWARVAPSRVILTFTYGTASPPHRRERLWRRSASGRRASRSSGNRGSGCGYPSLPPPRVRAAVDVEDLAGDEFRRIEIEHGGADLRGLSDALRGREPGQEALVHPAVQRRVDDPGRDRIHADAFRGVLDRERASGGL